VSITAITRDYGDYGDSRGTFHLDGLSGQRRSGFKRQKTHTSAGDGAAGGVCDGGLPDLSAAASHQWPSGGAQLPFPHSIQK
jgi:hypothetical protein